MSNPAFRINHAAIRSMTRELQREFDKNPIRIAVEADADLPPAVHTTYNGPVVQVHGDRAQIAWNSSSVRQTQDGTSEVAAGYEDAAKLLTDILEGLPALGLPEAQAALAANAAEEALREVSAPAPDPGALQRSLTLIQGALAMVALRVVDGVGDAAQQWAQQAIEALAQLL